MMEDVRGTLVFDGQCGFCTRCMRWLRRVDRRRRILFVPAQRTGAHDLTSAQTAASVWWLGADGARLRGAAAANTALSAALGTRLPLALYRVTRGPQERLYAWVAANRYRFPGTTPHCTSHPDDCAAP